VLFLDFELSAVRVVLWRLRAEVWRFEFTCRDNRSTECGDLDCSPRAPLLQMPERPHGALAADAASCAANGSQEVGSILRQRLSLFARIAPVVVVQDTTVDDSARERLEAAWKTDAPRLWRALLATTGDRSVADDALSEAFAQALSRARELREPTRWIWRVAFKIAAGEMQRRRSTQPLADDQTMPDVAEARALVAALQQITPRQRSVLVLHYYAGYRTREIAQILGMSPSTARVHLSTGRGRLRRLLEDDDA
jgi:RNA polymerase sigma-70 factor (ECF subfamily)